MSNLQLASWMVRSGSWNTGHVDLRADQNLDFSSGVRGKSRGLDKDFFPVILSMAGGSSSLAHWLEQIKDNNLFRPDQSYVGRDGQPYIPIERRLGGPEGGVVAMTIASKIVRKIATIDENKTVLDAAKLMKEEFVGSVVVTNSWINRKFGGARVPSFMVLAINLREAVEEKGHLSNPSLERTEILDLCIEGFC